MLKLILLVLIIAYTGEMLNGKLDFQSAPSKYYHLVSPLAWFGLLPVFSFSAGRYYAAHCGNVKKAFQVIKKINVLFIFIYT
jgi:hypothetical protein